MIGLQQEQARDLLEVEALYDQCFAPGRQALSSYRLRDGVDPVAELCLIWRDDYGCIGGVIRNWPVQVAGHRALLLGPLAVHPTHQGEGLGALLMQEVIARARPLGWDRIILVGDPPYYARFGFVRLDHVRMPPPTNPDRVLGWGDWQGVQGGVTRA